MNKVPYQFLSRDWRPNLGILLLLVLQDPHAKFIPLNLEGPTISDAQNSFLTSRFTVDEIRKALKLLRRNKALGPDGFTMELFSKFWGLFQENFKSLFDDFYNNGKLNSCVKENFICLIKKKEDVLAKDVTPVSLTTLTYKILAKVLAKRLNK